MAYLKMLLPIRNDSPNEGRNRMTLQKLSGVDQLCDDFHYSLTASTTRELEQDEINEILGNDILITIHYLGKDNIGKIRYLSGTAYLIQLVQTRPCSLTFGDPAYVYEFEIRSWLHKLDYVRGCRIFQKQGNTAATVIKEVLTDLGYQENMHFQDKTTRPLEKIPYKTMYRESYGNFIRRLCHEYGIIWRFEHTEKGHVLVLENDSTLAPELSDSDWGKWGIINNFQEVSALQPVESVESASYIWKQAYVSGVARQAKDAHDKLVDFSYPGAYLDRDIGERKMQQQIQALAREQVFYKGSSHRRAFQAGKRFTFNEVRLPEYEGKQYLLTKVEIQADLKVFKNRFTAIPAKTPYLPLPDEKVRVPYVSGIQTAIVVGQDTPSKIHSDEMGRIKVLFHWEDQFQGTDGKNAAFLRMAMPAAGSSRGFVFPPNKGDEVVVSFVEGCIDKPIITGVVYHGKQVLPVNPGREPYKSIIKPHSDSQANQIVFSDKIDAEQLTLNAKKDYTLNVLNDRNVMVKNNEGVLVKKNSEHSVNQNRTIAVKGNQTVDIGKNETRTIKGQQDISVTKDITIETAKDYTLGVDGHLSIRAKSISIMTEDGDIILDISKNYVCNVTKDIEVKADGNITQNAEKNLTNKAAGDLYDSGKNVSLESEKDMAVTGKDITVEAGGSLVLTGKDITQNG